MYYYIHIIIVYVVFGIGAGVRYIYYRIRGKKKKYDDLIAPTFKNTWNILISAIVIWLFIWGAISLDERLKRNNPHKIETLMRKRY
ncbi:hypothetical protein [Dysgonomonas sp. BGC7]|uniref:hypothetical protein n=1 Tax=Dysgonomonas sp. BGC7 TaxID=1658008 RepID=UPI0006809135|nr:hypothetical protein [Dysgonomonas sp. BGC7]MBD8388434.1 hypothetical protein [Dysgonomonas sp. BGC7]